MREAAECPVPQIMPRSSAAPLLLLLAAAPAAATWPPNGGPAAAAALAARVLGPKAASLFEFRALPAGTCDESRGPCAVVSQGAAAGTVTIAGSTPVEMSYALAQYCQRELLMSFVWARSGGFQVANLPPSLPPLPAPMRFQKNCGPLTPPSNDKH